MENQQVLSPHFRTFHVLLAYFQPPPWPQPPSSDTSFPAVAISVLGVLTTAILLVSYYVLVIKCCLNWRRADVLGRLPNSSPRRRPWREDYLFTVYPTAAESRGLGKADIRAIRTFHFRKAASFSGKDQDDGRLLPECVVCLNEFEDGDGLRLLPGCAHAFHIDCIDAWLQNSANCPLCRADVVPADAAVLCDDGRPQEAHHYLPLHHGGSLVIVGEDEANDGGVAQRWGVASPEQQIATPTSQLQHLSSMGDECFDVRPGRGEHFGVVHPIRRPSSMNSSDQQPYLSVQGIHQNSLFSQCREMPNGEGCSSGASCVPSGGAVSSVWRSFFSFGRSSRSSAILPVSVES